MNLEKLTTNYILQDVEDRVSYQSKKNTFEELLEQYAHKYYPNEGNVNNEIQRSIFKEGFLVAMNLFK